MKTRNLDIYHCLACGAVAHCETDQDVPVCCERPMEQAAAETVTSPEPAVLDKAAGPAAARPPEVTASLKPR